MPRTSLRTREPRWPIWNELGVSMLNRRGNYTTYQTAHSRGELVLFIDQSTRSLPAHSCPLTTNQGVRKAVLGGNHCLIFVHCPEKEHAYDRLIITCLGFFPTSMVPFCELRNLKVRSRIRIESGQGDTGIHGSRYRRYRQCNKHNVPGVDFGSYLY